MKIGFIGLGNMGAPWRPTSSGGHDVTVFNRSPGKAARWSSSAHARQPARRCLRRR